MNRILFLGDSITDCNHSFTTDNLGTGYVKILSEHYPNDYLFVNGGTDGFTIPRIYEKWNRFYSEQSFSQAIILGGINDVAIAADTGLSHLDAILYLEKTAAVLEALIHQLLSLSVSVVLIEPFLFYKPDYLLTWKPWYEILCHLMKHIADTIRNPSFTFISVQNELFALSEATGLSKVTTDGIHLTQAGHQLLADLIKPSIL